MKNVRQCKIIELVESYEIETQDELMEYLRKSGFDVTQATVSRDIRALKLTKCAGKEKSQRYVYDMSSDGINGRLGRVIKDGIIDVVVAQNMIVVKTIAGMAMGVGAALDSITIEGIAGCIAGDDTVFCALSRDADIENVAARIRFMTKN